jgi:hypothetical protein
MIRFLSLLTVGLAFLPGCLPFEPFKENNELAQVPSNPYPPPPAPTQRAKINYAPAPQDVAWRVDAVGRKLLDGDAQTGLRPMFATMGVAEPEIFHVDAGMVYITEGLVRQCRSEGELAAVLASELGKMVAEREAVARRELREPERRVPIALPIGGNGYGMAADPTNMIELARFEKERPKTPRPLARPDPRKIAESLLERGGYQKAELVSADPILQNAERNTAIERQFKGLPAQGNWRP